jgi:hypothetical protein
MHVRKPLHACHCADSSFCDAHGRADQGMLLQEASKEPLDGHGTFCRRHHWQEK